MTNTEQILDNLSQLMKGLPQNPVTKLDEVNTIIHIYAVREEIKKATDDKYIQDCQKALNELEIHYRDISRKYISNYSPLEKIIKEEIK